MEKHFGLKKPDLITLPKVQDRITFIYLEHCKINRDNGAVTVSNLRGITHIPAASISVILLGPGCDISHRAMELIGDNGVSLIWVGEHGVKFYAHGRALTSHSRLLLKQAELVSNSRKHLQVARKMYQLRFPGEDVSELTMQQLRGREGSRVRQAYRKASKEWNVEWNGRDYKPDDYESSDPVNKALSAGNACLYGLAYSVICAMGCSPGLGFVHVGHELSFVYDIADLYKTEVVVPVAFKIAASGEKDIGSNVRRAVRDEFKSGQIIKRMVHDIQFLLSDEAFSEDEYKSSLYIWDNREGELPHGIQYGEDDDL